MENENLKMENENNEFRMKNDEFMMDNDEFGKRMNYRKVQKMKIDNLNSVIDSLIKLGLFFGVILGIAYFFISFIDLFENNLEDKANINGNIVFYDCYIYNQSINDMTIYFNAPIKDINKLDNYLDYDFNDFPCRIDQINLNLTISE